MRNEKVRNLVLAALFYAIGIVLPFATGQIPQVAKMMLLMHLPVFLCSLICGWQYGLPVGLLLPITRSLLFQMPEFYPTAVAMSFELATYGFLAGFLYRILRRTKLSSIIAVYIAMVAAMVAGRLVSGGATWLLYSFNGEVFTFEAFLAGAVLNAIPGIVMQLVLIPSVMASLDRQKTAVFGPQNKNY